MTLTWSGAARFWLSMAAAFVLGAAIGCFATIKLVQGIQQRRADQTQWLANIKTWLERELVVTAEQWTAIEPTARTAVDELAQLREDSIAEYRAIFGRLFMGMNEHLTPSQQDRLRQVIDKSRGQKAPW